MSKCGVLPCRCFPTSGLKTEIHKVNLRIQSKCGKLQTRKNSEFGHFHVTIHKARIVNDSCFIQHRYTKSTCNFNYDSFSFFLHLPNNVLVVVIKWVICSHGEMLQVVLDSHFPGHFPCFVHITSESCRTQKFSSLGGKHNFFIFYSAFVSTWDIYIRWVLLLPFLPSLPFLTFAFSM